MRAVWIVLPCLVAACANDLTLIERESLIFKAENERIRKEDLQARYERQKRKADALSEEILVLAAERERLYARYDQLRSEIAALSRRKDRSAQQRAALAKEFGDLQQRVAQLQAQIRKEREAQAELTKQRNRARGNGGPEAGPSGSKTAQ